MSTIAEIKLFLLRPPKPSSGSEALRVTKIPIPHSLRLRVAIAQNGLGDDDDGDDDEGEDVDFAKEGARVIKISPDRKWLAVVTPDSRILAVKLSISCPPPDGKGKASVSITTPVLELPRQERDLPPSAAVQPPPNLERSKKHSKRPPRVETGTLGAYPLTITKLVFSSTSDILAVSDISGNLDTFILSPPPSSSSSSSTETWIPNPANPLLPKLYSAISTMTFRPSTPSFPSDDRLLLLTAKDHSLLEFHVTSGKLSDWSRHNPPANLPAEFRGFKDRACGTYFESSERRNRERLWIWSTSWLCMFDLSRDLTPPLPPKTPAEKNNSKKRKAESGAGNRKYKTGGMLATGPTVTFPEPTTAATESQSESDGDGENEVVAGNYTDLSSARHSKSAAPRKGPRGNKPGGGGGGVPQRGVRGAYWSSRRYKNLLGFLPVGSREEVLMKGDGWDHNEVLEAMEMVVIERPMWDIKMPPRFYDGGPRGM